MKADRRPQRRLEQPDDQAARRLVTTSPAPSNDEAERAVLGLLMRDQAAYLDIGPLKAADFWRPQHRIVFEAIQQLAEAGQAHDPLGVAEHIGGKKLLEIGGAPFLTALHTDAIWLYGIETHAETVRRYAAYRALLGIGTEIIRNAVGATGDPLEQLTDVERTLSAFAATRSTIAPMPLEDVLASALDAAYAAKHASQAGNRVATGFEPLDTLAVDLQPATLTILAARPAVGKTSFAMQLALTLARADRRVCVFSIEMSAVEIGTRILAAETRIHGQTLRKGLFSDYDEDHLRAAFDRVADLPLDFVDCPGASIEAIASAARRTTIKPPAQRPAVYIVDYLQLIEAHRASAFQNRNEQISTISRTLKQLARETAAPWVVLSQLSRDAEKRGGAPRLSDLRDSGAIEQDADIVLFLHRTEARGPEIELHCAKNRNGPVGQTTLTFDGPSTTFSSPRPDWHSGDETHPEDF